MNAIGKPPGWHGKLPTLGDFASRRLDAAFVEPWDGWLAAGLLALRQARPEGWLADYLASPSWRFLLAPGVLPGAAGTQFWAGVLMPSVDRVGRYFPLTLALALGAGPATTQQMAALWHWLARLDELARDALHEDWTAEQLEEQLARMALPDVAPPPAAARPEGAGAVVEIDNALDAAQHIGAEAQRGWSDGARGRAWWHARPDEAAPRLLLSQGLPASAASLFGPP
ncbi:MAG: type VI secretion system-associated protein TagF [Burkholderiales bacterium]|nr:type VI secretion system-associated protein TagF [Burkholderiales bacterium]